MADQGQSGEGTWWETAELVKEVRCEDIQDKEKWDIEVQHLHGCLNIYSARLPLLPVESRPSIPTLHFHWFQVRLFKSTQLVRNDY